MNGSYRNVLHIILCEDANKNPNFSYPVQKRYIWGILLIKQIFLNDCYPFQTLINIFQLIISWNAWFTYQG